MEDKIMSILMSVESRMENFFLFHILRPIPRKSRCARKCENCVNCVKASRGFFLQIARNNYCELYLNIFSNDPLPP